MSESSHAGGRVQEIVPVSSTTTLCVLWSARLLRGAPPFHSGGPRAAVQVSPAYSVWLHTNLPQWFSPRAQCPFLLSPSFLPLLQEASFHHKISLLISQTRSHPLALLFCQTSEQSEPFPLHVEQGGGCSTPSCFEASLQSHVPSSLPGPPSPV